MSGGRNAREIARSLMLYDITAARNQFRTTHECSKGKHGFVSIEVSPHLARDTGGTIREARSLWNSVNRPNIFIKVPATREGLPAIRELIGEGINVNVTLLFGLPRYREVARLILKVLEIVSIAANLLRMSNRLPVSFLVALMYL